MPQRPVVARPGPLRGVAAVLSVALATALAGCSQVELARLYVANNGTEARLAQPLPVTLPFRDEDGWIVVQGRVGDSEPVDFVIDTGASMLAILTGPRTEGLPLDLANAHRLGAEGDLAAPFAAPQSGLDLAFGPLTLLDQTVLAIPLQSLKCEGEETPDPPFVGVIGHELLHRYVVEVNYDRREVTLHDPGTWTYRGSGTVVPVDISGRQPFVQAQVESPQGARYEARLHVDSGAGIDLSLFPRTHPAIVVPDTGATDGGCFVGGLATYRTGNSVDLRLGDAAAVNTPASYALDKEVIDDGQNGRLGARFLRRYNVVFDYARERMILEPRTQALAAGD